MWSFEISQLWARERTFPVHLNMIIIARGRRILPCSLSALIFVVVAVVTLCIPFLLNFLNWFPFCNHMSYLLLVCLCVHVFVLPMAHLIICLTLIICSFFFSSGILAVLVSYCCFPSTKMAKIWLFFSHSPKSILLKCTNSPS